VLADMGKNRASGGMAVLLQGRTAGLDRIERLDDGLTNLNHNSDPAVSGIVQTDRIKPD
jgi:hypothetical protein